MEFAELILTPKLDGVLLYDQLSERPVDGTLCITGHHLILSTRKEGAQELWLLHQNIDLVERKPNIVNNILEGGTIILKCKDLRIIALKIASPQEYFNISNSIEQLSNLEEAKMLYPFFYIPMYNMLEDGYSLYQPEQEFAKLLATSDDWRLTTVNSAYQVCPTYGAKLVVARSITDEQIVQSAAFRDGGRFPVLSYRHGNGAAMLRSAQPVAAPGVTKRCRADEAILNAVLGRSKKGFIFDTWGKGKSSTTETDQHYSQWKKVNRPIGQFSSVSALLDSFVKLMDACNDVQCSPDKWLSRLEMSGWLGYVLNALNAACVVAQCLDQEGAPVLVHGGKGLDTTLVVTSLVQIILNPDCRTIRGLQALIDREWLQGGYPFSTRHKHSCYTPTHQRRKSSSATFLLFLDCVYQLYAQFPCSFEYDHRLLVTLFEHSYFSQYGTFLGDCERERVQLKVFSRTTSLWSHLNRHEVVKSLLNPLYEPNQAVIWPSVAPISIVLWAELYTRWSIDQSQLKITFGQIQALISREKDLRSRVLKLHRQLAELQREYQLVRNEKNGNSSGNHNHYNRQLHDADVDDPGDDGDEESVSSDALGSSK
ncbi:myotubularin-related protein 9 [Anopheles ziemanni]|uniref:myotubularin-related protein 9 n=1 Tax=Anopheles coustani TaxID=139045 RepID=UPI002657AE84|nr:myotubularin-related protein 9 [Anopheles coustani]XP_058174177.1 myotubularin-related protein 9 [Anopheles ziemanni]